MVSPSTNSMMRNAAPSSADASPATTTGGTGTPARSAAAKSATSIARRERRRPHPVAVLAQHEGARRPARPPGGEAPGVLRGTTGQTGQGLDDDGLPECGTDDDGQPLGQVGAVHARTLTTGPASRR